MVLVVDLNFDGDSNGNLGGERRQIAGGRGVDERAAMSPLRSRSKFMSTTKTTTTLGLGRVSYDDCRRRLRDIRC